MKSLILLIHTQAHVDLLPATAATIVAAGYNRCWVIISPALAADAASVTEKFDSEIASLRAAQKAAADREDYEAASGHKLALQGKVLDRDSAIADAWKSVPEEDRKVVYQSKLTPLFSELSKRNIAARMTCTQEHYAAAQWIQMLNSLSGVWPPTIVHGEYVVAWPGALPEAEKTNGLFAAPTVADPEMKPEPQRLPETPKLSGRAAELQEMHGSKRRALAVRLGIDPNGKPLIELIHEIIEAESRPPVVAAGGTGADLATY